MSSGKIRLVALKITLELRAAQKKRRISQTTYWALRRNFFMSWYWTHKVTQSRQCLRSSSVRIKRQYKCSWSGWHHFVGPMPLSWTRWQFQADIGGDHPISPTIFILLINCRIGQEGQQWPHNRVHLIRHKAMLINKVGERKFSHFAQNGQETNDRRHHGVYVDKRYFCSSFDCVPRRKLSGWKLQMIIPFYIVPRGHVH